MTNYFDQPLDYKQIPIMNILGRGLPFSLSQFTPSFMLALCLDGNDILCVDKDVDSSLWDKQEHLIRIPSTYKVWVERAIPVLVDYITPGKSFYSNSMMKDRDYYDVISHGHDGKKPVTTIIKNGNITIYDKEFNIPRLTEVYIDASDF